MKVYIYKLIITYDLSGLYDNKSLPTTEMCSDFYYITLKNKKEFLDWANQAFKWVKEIKIKKIDKKYAVRFVSKYCPELDKSYMNISEAKRDLLCYKLAGIKK